MLGTIVNTVAIIIGGLAGLLFRGGIPKKYNETIMHAIGLAVILVGLTGALKVEKILIVIFSMALGTLIGEFLRIEDRLENLGKWLEDRFSSSGDGKISKAFVTTSLIYCVGSMAIIGSMESGLSGNHQTLFAKSALDGIASVVFASTLGAGVLLSSISVFVYQGFITVAASFMKQFLTPDVVNQMSVTGGLLIMAIGFNLLEIIKIKIGNMLPAIFIPLVYFMLRQFVALL
jgi:uncharacterized membrane protein YqgA involved in biofilm formation